MKEIARQAFGSLNHDEGTHYIVLVDGNFTYDIYADSDEQAEAEWRKRISKHSM